MKKKTSEIEVAPRYTLLYTVHTAYTVYTVCTAYCVILLLNSTTFLGNIGQILSILSPPNLPNTLIFRVCILLDFRAISLHELGARPGDI